MTSRLKYLIPNGLTAASLCFAVIGIQAAVVGRPREAAWWVLYCVLTDKLDGIAARALSASSGFGMQLDSLADLVAFGVAPATVIYSFFAAHPELGWGGHGAIPLRLIAAGYVVCTAVRLARFNVSTDAAGAEKIFFGVASTFAGGTVIALLLTLLKYGAPSWSESPASDPRLFGGARLDGLMPLLPVFLAIAGASMVSPLRVPKVRRTGRRLVDGLVIGNVVVCYAIGLVHWLPEYLAASAVGYFVMSLGYHLLSRSTRGLRPPPLFPATPPAG